MSSLRTRSILAFTGLYSAAALCMAVANSASTPSSHLPVHQVQSVDRAHKGGLLTRFTASKDAGPSISVELPGRSDVVIRDSAGNILFAVNNSARATTIAKQRDRSASAPKANQPAELDLPDGCEGAFSAYAEPSKARIIGRCISSIVSQAEVT
jgi:hypothetical protein